MPDWVNYTFSYYVDTSANREPFYTSLTPLTYFQIQKVYEEYQHDMAEEKQLQEDKEKYPLLFLKEGIV